MAHLVTHPIPPLFDAESKILILGTMPSPKSREQGFYYAHPQNRFWPVLAALFAQKIPAGNGEREEFLHRHHIALWDVLQSCEIQGAQDNSIRNPVVNDLRVVLNQADIGAVFTTGTKAAALYKRFCQPAVNMPAIALPSTSPANCGRYRFADLVDAYREILAYL